MCSEHLTILDPSYLLGNLRDCARDPEGRRAEMMILCQIHSGAGGDDKAPPCGKIKIPPHPDAVLIASHIQRKQPPNLILLPL